MFKKNKTDEEITEKPDPHYTVNGRAITKRERNLSVAAKWAIMPLGALMMSCSVYFFQTPNHFTLGGIAGLSIILDKFVPFLSQAQIMAIINVALLIIGFIILGKKCTLLTIICSLLYTGLIYLFEATVPLKEQPISGNALLDLCYAILLLGIGNALIFNIGASSGGTDIIALIVKKYTKMNIGIALMIVDYVIVAISFFAYDFQVLLYSALGLFVKSFLLDGVIESIGKTRYITIITQHPDVISKYILEVIRHGYTVYDAQGGYTGDARKVIITVCKRGEAMRLKTKVKEADPEAFVIITDAKEILGKGFGSYN